MPKRLKSRITHNEIRGGQASFTGDRSPINITDNKSVGLKSDLRTSRKLKPQSNEVTLHEKAQSIKALWDQLVLSYHKKEVGFVTELPIKIIQDWLVKEQVALDVEKAKIILNTEIGSLRFEQKGLLTFDEFSRLFTKACLRKALIDVAAKYGSLMKTHG